MVDFSQKSASLNWMLYLFARSSRQSLTSFCPSSIDGIASRSCSHPPSEPKFILSLSSVWLVCPLQFVTSFHSNIQTGENPDRFHRFPDICSGDRNNHIITLLLDCQVSFLMDRDSQVRKFTLDKLTSVCYYFSSCSKFAFTVVNTFYSIIFS